jgi:hypothetical protein
MEQAFSSGSLLLFSISPLPDGITALSLHPVQKTAKTRLVLPL